MRKVIQVLSLVIAAVLFLAWIPDSLNARQRSRAPVRVRASFDNAYIHISRPAERYLEINVAAPNDYVVERGERPPMNIALVIDKSGSMAQAGKLAYVKEAAREMIDRLQYGDRFAVVAYDDDVRVLIKSQLLEDRKQARRLVDRLNPGGSTNLGGGLLEGYRQVSRHYISGGTNRVLLLSDGLANRGITSPRELSNIVNRESRNGISLTTFGVGREFNEDLLASMAESGLGTYYYIDEAGRIPEILAREFSAVQQIVALNVTITIEVHANVVIDDIMGYEYRREGNRYIVRLGDMSSSEERRIIARLRTPSLSVGLHRIGGVKIDYLPQGLKKSVSSRQDLSLNYVDNRKKVELNLNREVAERSSVYEANSARKKAARMVDDGNVEGARQVLEEAKGKLKNAPVQGKAVMKELEDTDAYQSAIEKPMSAGEKSSVQKDIKYRSYKVLQSK